MKTQDLISIINSDYINNYSNFKDFALKENYKTVWDLCMDTVRNRDLLINVIFCNNVYHIPPVRVFIDIHRHELHLLKAQDTQHHLFTTDGLMKTYLKQSIGAFWGMVFRFGLGYTNRKSMSMVKEKYFGIQTASRFSLEEESYPMDLLID